jgi:hypothetical protein
MSPTRSGGEPAQFNNATNIWYRINASGKSFDIIEQINGLGWINSHKLNKEKQGVCCMEHDRGWINACHAAKKLAYSYSAYYLRSGVS